MNTASRQGLGFEYEDKIRTSAIIHMYSNMHFLDLDSHITSITLGGAKFGYKTDDIVIENSKKKYCIQIKKTITGVADDSFSDFIINAYFDFLREPTNYYCLIAEDFGKDFYNSMKNLLSNVNGSSNEFDFKNIVITKKEELLRKEIVKKIKTENIFNFLKTIKIFAINANEEKSKNKIILNQFRMDDLNQAYNVFFLKVKELKENNQTIDEHNYYKHFGFINYDKQTKVNKDCKNNIIEYIDVCYDLIKNSYNYEDYHKFFTLTNNLVNKISHEDNILLNVQIQRSIKILEVIIKYSLAVTSDLRVLNQLITSPDIQRLTLIYNGQPSEIVNNLSPHDCVYNIFNQNIKTIHAHYEFVVGRKPYNFEYNNGIVNLLLSKSSNFYHTEIPNHKYISIELLDLLKRTLSGQNIIDTIAYVGKLENLMNDDYDILMNVLNKDAIHITLDFIKFLNIYQEDDIKELKNIISSINLIFIVFMSVYNKHKKLGIQDNDLRKLHFLGDHLNKINSENSQHVFMKYLDCCQKNDINNSSILMIENMIIFLNLMDNIANESMFDEKKIISLIFTKDRLNNKWYQENEDLLNNSYLYFNNF